MIDEEKVIERAVVELKRMERVGVCIEIPMIAAVQLISNLQLALTHPGNRGPNAKVAREMCDLIIKAIEPLSAELAAFCRLGYKNR